MSVEGKQEKKVNGKGNYGNFIIVNNCEMYSFLYPVFFRNTYIILINVDDYNVTLESSGEKLDSYLSGPEDQESSLEAGRLIIILLVIMITVLG